jgi:dolichol kinase
MNMNEKNNVKEKAESTSGKQITFRAELARKAIHLSSLSIPIAYHFVDKTTALLILIPLALIVTVGDIVSKRVVWFGHLVNFFFGKILRKHEKPDSPHLNGASWVMISAVLVVAAFPKFIAMTAITILIISDIFAAIVGRSVGKHKVYDKTIEGSAAFFFSALAIIGTFYLIYSPPVMYLFAGVFASFIATFAELLSNELDIDDNIAIPFMAGMVLWIVSSLADNYGSSFAYFLK